MLFVTDLQNLPKLKPSVSESCLQAKGKKSILLAGSKFGPGFNNFLFKFQLSQL